MGTGISVGVDLGQSADYTAIVMLETYRPDRLRPKEFPDVRHRIRWIERVPLGTQYTAVVDRIATVAEAAQGWGHTTIVLDATGVGRPVVDMLKRRTSVLLRAVTFTSGEHETRTEFNVHRVPKIDLVTSLEAVLQTRRLEVVPDAPLQAELAAELAAFDFSINGRGHASFEAQAGNNDDLVAALMLAVFWNERPSAFDAWLEFRREHRERTPQQQADALGPGACAPGAEHESGERMVMSEVMVSRSVQLARGLVHPGDLSRLGAISSGAPHTLTTRLRSS